MRRSLNAKIGAIVVLLACAAACGRPAPRPHQSLDHTLNPLREQFNADADRTRILMIVAPT